MKSITGYAMTGHGLQELITLLALACCTLAACAHSERELAPAAMAHAAGHVPNAALDEDQDVKLIAQAHDWPSGVERDGIGHLIPFKIWLYNGSPRALQVRLGSFVLSTADNSDYRAVPLLPGPATREVIRGPEFEQTAFEVAPYFADAYPGLPAYSGRFAYQSLYYSRYYDAKAADAVSDGMLRQILPEGVLEPGGRLVGYVVFQRPSETDLQEGNVRFRLELAERGAAPAYARLSIPFADRSD